MNTMKRYIHIIWALALAAVSCVKPQEQIELPVSPGRVTLEVSSDSRSVEMSPDAGTGTVSFKTKGGSVVLDVLTNQDEWTYETSGESWLEVSSDDYFLYLEAEPNTSDRSNTATVVVKAAAGDDEASVTLTVTQNHSGVPEISLSQNRMRVKAYTGLVQEITVDTNQEEWDFDCTCSWAYVEKVGDVLRLEFESNTDFAQRTVDIQVKTGAGEKADSDWLTVSQDGTAYVRLSTHNVASDDEGDTRTVVVESNPELEWDYSADGSDWYSVSAEGRSLSVTIDPNEGGNERKGIVTVTVGDEDNSAETDINIHQIGPDTEELIYEVLISEPGFMLTGAPVLTSSSEGSVTVDWGDGTPQETFENRRPTHVYAQPGRYTIVMSGTAKSLEFGNGETYAPELQSVISWGKMGYTTAADMCLGCSSLKYIPNDVAGSFSAVKSFLGAFSCCLSLEDIPSGLFRYASVAKNFEDCFSHCGSISSIPEDLFAECKAAEDFTYAFYGTGSGVIVTTTLLANFDEVRSLVSAGKLKEIPGGLFRNCPSVRQMDYVFGATSITEVPADIFASQTSATIFTGAFSSCVNLTSVGKYFMSKAVSATDIKYMFAGCESLKTFPSGAFLNNQALTNLEYMFYKTGFETLPGGIFEGLVNVKTIGAVFQDCVNLTSISPELFKGLTGAKSFKYCFSGCTSLRQIPSGLFAGLTNAYEFRSTFEDSAIESVPEDLFKDSRDYSSADFSYAFAGCMNLKTVPAGLFDTFTKVTSPGFKNAFAGSGIETVPAGLFAKNASVSAGFEETFYDCTALKTIEGPIFAETSSVTSVTRMFNGCTSLTSLPEGLFDPLAQSKVKFTAVFKGCTSLETLPDGLFAANTLATQLTEAFSGCTSLKSLPADLIGEKPKVTMLRSVFKDCTSLKSIPEGLFAGCPAVTSFEAAFSNCTGLEEIPEDIFSAIGTTTSSVSFIDCFSNCSSLRSLPSGMFDSVRRINYVNRCFNGCVSLKGESPYTVIAGEKVHLYERQRGDDFPVVPSSASANKECFTGCVGLDDYNAIPSSWK